MKKIGFLIGLVFLLIGQSIRVYGQDIKEMWRAEVLKNNQLQARLDSVLQVNSRLSNKLNSSVNAHKEGNEQGTTCQNENRKLIAEQQSLKDDLKRQKAYTKLLKNDYELRLAAQEKTIDSLKGMDTLLQQFLIEKGKRKQVEQELSVRNKEQSEREVLISGLRKKVTDQKNKLEQLNFERENREIDVIKLKTDNHRLSNQIATFQSDLARTKAKLRKAINKQEELRVSYLKHLEFSLNYFRETKQKLSTTK